MKLVSGLENSKYETSILMSLYPDAVDLSRLGERKHWFTEAAKDASTEIGDKMVSKSLEYLKNAIK